MDAALDDNCEEELLLHLRGDLRRYQEGFGSPSLGSNARGSCRNYREVSRDHSSKATLPFEAVFPPR